ncbi:MAG: FAD-dependent oxidoreductase [bacterium]|jgi:hypothetical protein
MSKIIVIGGGWSGCAAALAARKAGADVILLERTDMLLGAGLVGGIIRNNGRFTAAEEAIALGGGDLFNLADATARHVNIDFPGHAHASLYDIVKIEPAVRNYLLDKGIDVRLETRITDIRLSGGTLKSVVSEEDEVFVGDVFVETTGTSGPMGNCRKYGNGCAMCVQRCPAFGPRVSIAAQAGIKEMIGRRLDDFYGAMSGSGKLNKDSLAPDIREQLEKTGVAVVPLPPEMIDKKKLAMKPCQQYALEDFAENIVLLDTGHAKIMTPFFPLEKLRKVPGFEKARYADPYAGGRGNSIRFLAMSPRDDYMQVKGLSNLFCGGEKTGLLVGHTEAIVTGTLAGHNAVRYALGRELLRLPRSTAIGEIIAFVRESMETEEGLKQKYTFSGSVFFERMKEMGLYTTDIGVIRDRVAQAGLTDVFARKLL